MNNHVVIKSNKYGLSLMLDQFVPYEELLSDIEETFLQASKFFSGASLTISFEGRHLTKEEEWEIVNLISKTAHIHILCIMDQDHEKEQHCKRIVEEKLHALSMKDGLFYKGTLRKKQVLESERNITILGDVEAGATVVSKGSILVLGNAEGTLHAGITGRQDAFIAALSMRTSQLKIANVSSSHLFQRPKDINLFQNPEIAVLNNKKLFIAPIGL